MEKSPNPSPSKLKKDVTTKYKKKSKILNLKFKI